MVMFPVLEETQRIQYLQALGVTSWLPTGPLVGSEANDSQWCEAHQLALEPSAPVETGSLTPKSSTASLPTEVLVASPALQHQAAAAIDALSSLTVRASNHHVGTSTLAQQPKELSGEASSSVHEAATKQGATHRENRLAPLHLGLSWYANGVLVVNDIPVQEGAAMSSPIQRLQTAIVNAIRPALSDASVQVMPAASMEFNWPLVPGPHADHSVVGAQSGLNYSLIKLLKDNPCSKLLVMGPASIKLLKPEMALGETSTIKLSGRTIESVYSHSLHQLLAVPSLKKETWTHLKSLLNSLKSV